MRASKKRRLEAAGWVFGDAKDFLGLRHDESEFIDLKISLSIALKQRRLRESLTQSQVAAKIESSQSRVAKMEAGDPAESLDLLIRSLLALGMTRKEIAKVIATRPRRRVAS